MDDLTVLDLREPLADDEFGMAEAWAVSVDAQCRRRSVGAVLMDGGVVIGRGANRSADPELSCLRGECPRGRLSYDELPSQASYGDAGTCIALHAEGAALAAIEGPVPPTATLYVTHEPCLGCTLTISEYGVRRVVTPAGIHVLTPAEIVDHPVAPVDYSAVSPTA